MRFGPLSALALACACAQAQKPPSAGGAFQELQSDHYVLVTDLAELAARAAIARMEDVRAALLELSQIARQCAAGHNGAVPRRTPRRAISVSAHKFADAAMPVLTVAAPRCRVAA